MKISKSKQELARIISENGGWRDGAEWATQDHVVAFFSGGKPKYETYDKTWCANVDDGVFIVAISADEKIKGFHNTILSRAEYFHIYPARDADGWIEWKGGERPVDGDCIVSYKMRDAATFKRGEPASEVRWTHNGVASDIIAYLPHKPEQAKAEFCESVMRSIPEPEYKPSIEQLMQAYADIAHSLQLANEHLATCARQANEAMEALSAACKANGFDISPITEKQEPELAITNRSQLELGDVIWIGETGCKTDDDRMPSGEYVVVKVGMIGVLNGDETYYPDFSVREWRFIRRP